MYRGRYVSNTHSDEGAGQKMELAGTRATHARAPPGALSHVKLTSDLLTRRFSQTYQILRIENATKKCLRIGSYGEAIGRHCVANLYKGELQ